MSWKRLDVEFTLKSPLHIGYLPSKGSVISPTRYYVPGKNFWGAVTKRLTEHLCDNPRGKDYQTIGKEIEENFRFTYFYIHDGKKAYMPEFKDGKGLVYGGQDNYDFENRFIGSRVMTALDKNGSGTAEDGSLHEIEFINNRYKDRKGNINDTKLIGCIFIKNDGEIKYNYKENYSITSNKRGIFVDDFNIIEELTIGGEQKYGFGIVELTGIGNIKYPVSFTFDNDEITFEVNENTPLFSHLEYSTNLPFKGDIELVSGREYKDPRENGENDKRYHHPGKKITKTKRYFAPGTIILEKIEVLMDYCGLLTLKKNIDSESTDPGDNGVES